MKKISLVAALMVLLCGASLSAKSFDWSQSWCNYGAGVKEGDFLVTADVALDFTDFGYLSYTNGWFMPPVMAEVQYAKKIWKLPFTFGGFVGFGGHGYKYIASSTYSYPEGYTYTYANRYWWNIFFGAEAAYHAKLPVETLDVYIITRLGVNIPITNGYTYFGDYILFGEAIGMNWFFTDKVGLNAEIGYPFTKVGATFKF